MKIKSKEISGMKKNSIIYEWVVKGKTFAEIGKKRKISRQAVKQKFDVEAEDIYVSQKFDIWLDEISKDKEGKPYPYLNFGNEVHGKFYAYMLRKYFGYHVIDGKFATKDALDIQKIRTLLIKRVKDEGLPLYVPDTPTENPYAYFDNLFFTREKAWSKFFVVGEMEEKKGEYVLALRGESMIFNLCLVMVTADKKRNAPISVDEGFGYFPESFKAEKGVKDKKALSAYLLEKRKYIYKLPSSCKQPFKEYAGIKNKLLKDR